MLPFFTCIYNSWRNVGMLREYCREAGGLIVSQRWHLTMVPVIGILVRRILDGDCVIWRRLIVRWWLWRDMGVVWRDVAMVWRYLSMMWRDLMVI
jgi:hypothetical protein